MKKRLSNIQNPSLFDLSCDIWGATETEENGIAYFWMKEHRDLSDTELYSLSQLLSTKNFTQFIFKGQLFTIIEPLSRDGVSVGFYATPF